MIFQHFPSKAQIPCLGEAVIAQVYCCDSLENPLMTLKPKFHCGPLPRKLLLYLWTEKKIFCSWAPDDLSQVIMAMPLELDTSAVLSYHVGHADSCFYSGSTFCSSERCFLPPCSTWRTPTHPQKLPASALPLYLCTVFPKKAEVLLLCVPAHSTHTFITAIPLHQFFPPASKLL